MKTYESPELEISVLDSSDVITVSKGDTPIGGYEW